MKIFKHAGKLKESDGKHPRVHQLASTTNTYLSTGWLFKKIKLYVAYKKHI